MLLEIASTSTTPTENLLTLIWAQHRTNPPGRVAGENWKILAEKLHRMSARFRGDTRASIITLRNIATYRAANP